MLQIMGKIALVFDLTSFQSVELYWLREKGKFWKKKKGSEDDFIASNKVNNERFIKYLGHIMQVEGRENNCIVLFWQFYDLDDSLSPLSCTQNVKLLYRISLRSGSLIYQLSNRIFILIPVRGRGNMLSESMCAFYSCCIHYKITL